jgi:hypothetical protein
MVHVIDGAALLFVMYLAILNRVLSGAKRRLIDAVLTIFLVGLLVWSWYFYGWLIVLAIIAVSPIVGALMRPIARRNAAWLLRR